MNVERFVEDCLEYANNMVATNEQLGLPKPIPLHISPRSLSSDNQGGRYDRGSSGGRSPGHGRQGGLERRQEEGVLLATQGMGPGGEVNSGLSDDPGVRREALAGKVRGLQEADTAAKDEKDRRVRAVQTMLPSSTGERLLVPGEGA
jgi:hypothetical protein